MDHKKALDKGLCAIGGRMDKKDESHVPVERNWYGLYFPLLWSKPQKGNKIPQA